MAEMTVEQRRALALANARRRAAESGRSPVNATPAPTPAPLPTSNAAQSPQGAAPPADDRADLIRKAYRPLDSDWWSGAIGKADDLVRMAANGASFNFADKIAGLLGGQGTEAEQQRTAEAAERTGPAGAAAYIGGAVLPLSSIPRAASIVPAGWQGLRGGLARMGVGAAEGAGYGGLAAAGADQDIGRGAAFGAAFGGAAEPVASGLGALGGGVANFVRGTIAPGREASRRVALARTVDDTIPQPRIGAAESATAGRAGQPLMNIDRGGEATRELARSSANVSPLAWSTLDSTLRNRFQGQVPRVVDAVRRLVGGNSSMANRDMLRRMGTRANQPAYRHAMTRPSAQSVWDETLFDLTGAPEVQSAIRQAAARARSAAVIEGVPPIRNPFRMDPQTGRMTPVRGVTPNLRFWDEVKKALDETGTRESRTFARTLREHLDGIVPEYGVARAGAARFFDAEDALEAGEQFATSSLRLGNDEAAAAIQRFTRPERQLFMEGFADALVKRLESLGDNRNVTINAIFNSPAARERIVLALGPRRAQELEAILRVEELMDMARAAMGNSTTARQLLASGVVGGTAGGAMSGGDVKGITAGALAGILMRTGVQSVNADVATRVAQMLVSRDPAVVQRGIGMVARNEALMDAVRAATLAGGISMASSPAAVAN